MPADGTSPTTPCCPKRWTGTCPPPCRHIPGEQYAKEHGYDVHYFPAEWKRYGKAAGYIRNTEMAKNADALVAFWDGASLGTKHMIATAEQLHLDVHVVMYGKGE